MTKFLRGDVVNVRGVVAFDHSEDAKFVTYLPFHDPRDGSLIGAAAADVQLIHHSFKAGDRVEYLHVTGQHRDGTVEHISGQFAWVNLGNDDFDTVDLADLTPAAPPSPPAFPDAWDGAPA